MQFNAMWYTECCTLTIPFSASSSVENGRGSLDFPISLSLDTNRRIPAFAADDRPGTLSNKKAYAGCLLYFIFERKNVAICTL